MGEELKAMAAFLNTSGNAELERMANRLDAMARELDGLMRYSTALERLADAVEKEERDRVSVRKLRALARLSRNIERGNVPDILGVGKGRRYV